MPKINNILVLTSGGDAPGMNAAIRAVVRSAHYYGINTYASYNGYDGLVKQQIKALLPEHLANCIQRGGTILKSDRCCEFYQRETRDKVRNFLREQKIDGIVVIGGDGSFRGASLLQTEYHNGPAVIGIPATIDNDIIGTEYSIGFDTALNTALEAIDRIRDTASSHDRNFLIEVMGNTSGFLATEVGVAGGAEFILTPEFPISIKKLAQVITTPKRVKLSSIIIVAEGHQPGRSIHLAKELEQLTNLCYRVCILGHTQRGGNPTAKDRLIASQMGALAVKSLLEEKSNAMVAIQNNQLITTNFPDPSKSSRKLSNDELIQLTTMLAQ